jgi:hypothetical protein
LLFASFFTSAIAINAISVSKSCFTVGEDISITFRADNPRNDDWIGIYPPNQALSSLPDPEGIKWIWTCGRRSCSSEVGIARATVSYISTLEVGTWKVVLAHNAGPPYAGLAQSETFSVRTSCATDSNLSPVRSPTLRPTVRPSTRRPTARAPVTISSVQTPTLRPTMRPTVRPTVKTTFRPTVKTTLRPTVKTTPRPTVRGTVTTPVGSPTSLTTSKASFETGEKIVISFINSLPKPGDWIGVYPSSAPSNNLRTGDLWLWTCGSQSCGTSVSQTINQRTQITI